MKGPNSRAADFGRFAISISRLEACRAVRFICLLSLAASRIAAQEPAAAAAETAPTTLSAVAAEGGRFEANLISKLDQLSVEQLVGQTLMVGVYPSSSVEETKQRLVEMVRKYNLGGIILYKDSIIKQYDIVDPLSIPQYVAELTASLQREALRTVGIPLFIAVDQEGAPLDPITTGVTDIPDHVHLGASRSERLALQAGCVVGSELSMMGVNMVLAPLADIVTSTDHDFIGKRAFGAHRDIVTPLAVRFYEGLRDGGVISVAKHFPGRGTSKDNPHFNLPIMTHMDRAELFENDLEPFRRLIEAGVDGILTSHVLANPIDNENPVTISKDAISRVLRQEMGYEGLVISDDISYMMGILKDENGRLVRERTEVARQALEAGHDIVIFGRIYQQDDQKWPERSFTEHEFQSAVQDISSYFDEPKKIGLLRSHVARILQNKERKLTNEFAGGQTLNRLQYEALLQSHREIARAIARESVVLLTEDGSAVNHIEEAKYFSQGKGPLSKGLILSSGDKVLVVSSVFTPPDELYESLVENWIPSQDIAVVRMVYGWSGDAGLETASARWGEPVERFSYADDFGQLKKQQAAIFKKVDEILDAAKDVRVIIFAVSRRDQVEVLRAVAREIKGAGGPELIVLAALEPYLLPSWLFKQRGVTILFLSLYPRMNLASEVLFGETQPKPLQYLPLAVSGLARRSHQAGQPIKSENLLLSENCWIESIVERSEEFTENDDFKIPVNENSEVDEETVNELTRRDGFPFVPGLMAVLAGSLAGSFLFLVSPSAKFHKPRTAEDGARFQKGDVVWTLLSGVVATIMIYSFGWVLGWQLDVMLFNVVGALLDTGWGYIALAVFGAVGGVLLPTALRKSWSP